MTDRIVWLPPSQALAAGHQFPGLMSHDLISRCVAIATVATALVACQEHDGGRRGSDASPASSMASTVPVALRHGPNAVTIVAREYAFDAPAEIPAGLMTVRLVDKGRELHQVQFLRLAPGKTAADYMRSITSNEPPPAEQWVWDVGGVNPPPVGGEASATFTLAPGNYVLMCFIPSTDGVPHAMKGMMRPLTVTQAVGPPVPEPAADVGVQLTDFAFTLSGPVTPGIHTLRVENDGTQVHELMLVRLAPGKTVRDILAWADTMRGPMPGVPMGGPTSIPPGDHAFATEEFQPGDYALLCFTPDPTDGKPHTAHGMVRQIRVGPVSS